MNFKNIFTAILFLSLSSILNSGCSKKDDKEDSSASQGTGFIYTSYNTENDNKACLSLTKGAKLKTVNNISNIRLVTLYAYRIEVLEGNPVIKVNYGHDITLDQINEKNRKHLKNVKTLGQLIKTDFESKKYEYVPTVYGEGIVLELNNGFTYFLKTENKDQSSREFVLEVQSLLNNFKQVVVDCKSSNPLAIETATRLYPTDKALYEINFYSTNSGYLSYYIDSWEEGLESEVSGIITIQSVNN